jgi:DNA replication and repair protein RecF
VHIQALSLTNFRNYGSLNLTCDPTANLFVGINGQGKTNILESIYYLCVARSCRDASDKELVNLNEDFFKINGTGISSAGREVELDIRYTRYSGKKVYINQQPQRSLSELYGLLAAVVMAPDDRQLVQGSPSFRRRFLDIAISQSNPGYLATLQDYRRVVRQRNEALRMLQSQRGGTSDLVVWDTHLIALGVRIMKKRIEVIEQFKKEAQKLHSIISDKNESLEIAYTPSFKYDSESQLENPFQEAIERSERVERARGVTMVGPHRDDLTLSMDGVPLQSFGSQGQHKTAATALKLAEAQFLWTQLETPPLLLLDDIFAELDADRTARLIELLPTFGQVFITAAKESDFGTYSNKFQRFRVHAGTVTPFG